jgi:hypothetical protein
MPGKRATVAWQSSLFSGFVEIDDHLAKVVVPNQPLYDIGRVERLWLEARGLNLADEGLNYVAGVYCCCA